MSRGAMLSSNALQTSKDEEAPPYVPTASDRITRQKPDKGLSRRHSVFSIPSTKGRRHGGMGRISKRISAFMNSHREQHPSEKAKKSLSNFSSVNYSPSHSEAYIDWLRGHGSSNNQRGWEVDRWLLLFLVGVVTGLVAALIAQCIQGLSGLRWQRTKSNAEDGDYFTNFCSSAGIAVAYVVISSALVLFIHPPAAGGGTPDVIGYLNGVVVHRVFGLRNLVVKFLSNVFAVSSGLPCATQGPIITYGAILGMGVGQFKSSTLDWAPRLFRRFRNAEDRRAFTTAGVAAGVSAAFNAPIGGLMFAMEDISSFWSKSLSWQVFFTAVVAQGTAGIFRTSFHAFSYQGVFGLFSLSILWSRSTHYLFSAKACLAIMAVWLPATCWTVGMSIAGGKFVPTFVNLEMFKARDVMACNVATIRVTESVAELSDLLVSTRHEGFPVVKRDPESGYDVMFGPLTRTELYAILYNEGELLDTQEGVVIRPEVPYESVSVDYVADPSAAEERIRRCYAKFDVYRQIYVDLENYVNDSAPIVDADYSLHRTYNVFRTLGLRHLVVVDLVNRVVGMITREDLMAFRIAERLSTLPKKFSVAGMNEFEKRAVVALLPTINKPVMETVQEEVEEQEDE